MGGESCPSAECSEDEARAPRPHICEGLLSTRETGTGPRTLVRGPRRCRSGLAQNSAAVTRYPIIYDMSGNRCREDVASSFSAPVTASRRRSHEPSDRATTGIPGSSHEPRYREGAGALAMPRLAHAKDLVSDGSAGFCTETPYQVPDDSSVPPTRLTSLSIRLRRSEKMAQAREGRERLRPQDVRMSATPCVSTCYRP